MSELIYGSKVSLFIAFFVSLVSALIGTALGLLSGYFERVGFFIMRIVDAFLAIPRLPLIIVIAVFIRLGTRHQESHIYIRIIWMAIHCPHYTLRGAITQKFHIRLVKMVDASAAPGLCITFTILSLTFIYGTITFYQNVHPLNHLKLSLYLYAMG